jgi:hypothetical protein
MAEQDNNTQQTAGAQPAGTQQRQARPCPRDCSKCGYQQHAYCAARMAFQMFEVMNGVIQRLDIQSQRIADLEQRITALQSSEAEFSSPLPVEGDIFADTE